MATASPSTAMAQPKRTSVRMLQAPCMDSDVGGAVTSPRTPAGPAGPQPPGLGPQASRRRSATFLLPPTEYIDSFSCEAFPGCSSGSGSTVPASPAGLQRRVTQLNDTTPPAAATASSAAEPSGGRAGVGGCADPDGLPHLSVPLTLLSLHNGGLRHSPRANRDVSPCANLLISREGSISYPFSFPGGDPDLLDSATAIDASSGAGGGAGGAGGLLRRGSDRISVTAASPPRRTTSSILRPATLPAATALFPDTSSPGPASPPSNNRASVTSDRVSVTGIVAAATPRSSTSPVLTAGAGAVELSALDSKTAPADVGGVSLPPHLSSHRPPTPMCKEEDLLSSMRHMASPTRRRSRFASAADSQLLAAAAAAIAAEEAGMLDSSGSLGGSGGSGGSWSFNGMLSEPRPGRRGALGSFGSETGSGGGFMTTIGSGGGGGGGLSGCESPLSRTGLAAAELSPRMPSMSSLSMSWRAAPPLIPVPEERPPSRSDDLSLSGLAGPSAAAAAAAAAAGATDLLPALPPLPAGLFRGPSLSSAGSFPRAATPGPGLAAAGSVGVLGRRLRSSISSNSNSQINMESVLAAARGSASSEDAAAATTADGTGLSDDSLSSFMHSFGPPPGTPSAERRCPTVATPAEVAAGGDGGGSLGMGLGPLGVAAGGRITAR